VRRAPWRGTRGRGPRDRAGASCPVAPRGRPVFPTEEHEPGREPPGPAHSPILRLRTRPSRSRRR
jgi:hypothetical protein